MTVQIAGHPISSLDQLSEPARVVVGLIVDGGGWLRSAIQDPGHRYHFASESSLVGGLQTGLHGSELLLILGVDLQASAERLLQVPPSLLKALEKAAAGSAKPSAATRKLLTQSNLRTAGELASNRSALKRLGIDGQPLFQSATLGDAIALWELFDSTSESKAAAAFAVKLAVNTQEFADYYRFYLTVAGSSPAESPGRSAGKSAAADQRAEAVLQVLVPVVWDLLRCPHVAEDLSPDRVGVLVRAWLAEGEPAIGFATASRAIAEIAALAEGAIADAAGAAAAAESFVETTRAVVESRDPGSGELSQDGSVQLFPIKAPDGTGVLLVHDRTQGALTVRSLTLPGRGAAVSSPPRSRKAGKTAKAGAAKKRRGPAASPKK